MLCFAYTNHPALSLVKDTGLSSCLYGCTEDMKNTTTTYKKLLHVHWNMRKKYKKYLLVPAGINSNFKSLIMIQCLDYTFICSGHQKNSLLCFAIDVITQPLP